MAAETRTADAALDAAPAALPVAVELSLLGGLGPTSARAEFDLETKLLVALRQWDNTAQRGVPAFESGAVYQRPSS